MFAKLKVFIIFTFTIIIPVSGHWNSLSDDTIPISYDLHIGTNIHEGKFDYSGLVRITLKANRNTDEIILHAKDFEDLKMHLIKPETGERFDNLKFYSIGRNSSDYDGKIRIVSKRKPLKLEAGKEYILSILYRSHLRDEVYGFYRTSYKDLQDNDVWFATTDFEPISARTAFPCYDDPRLKAKFSVRITHGMNFTAISNMPNDDNPIISKNDMITTKFQQSPLMSTYILAFVVTNYNSINLTTGNITHRLFYPPNMEPQKVCFNFAQETLRKFEEYFGIPYQLTKMDHIGVNDRYGRAMENWGLVIYKNDWLYRVANNTDDLVNIAILASHEMAHQWFGNLVTANSWSVIWLTEGFSTFYAYKILDLLYPHWNIWDYAICLELHMTFWTTLDNMPLFLKLQSDKDLNDHLGYHQYYKAAFILRMVEHSLSERTFKRGILNYLNKFQYASTSEDDLINNLYEVAREDHLSNFENDKTILENIIKSWSHEKGHPIVYVTRDYQSETFVLKQEQHNCGNKSDALWWIPITFTTSSSLDFHNTTTDFIFPKTRTMIVDPSKFGKRLTDQDWIILNKEQIGLYRVCYDQNNWKLIINALHKNYKIIPPYTRAQLIRDAIEFTKIRDINSKTLFSLLIYLQEETDLVPLLEGTRAFYYIRDNLDVQHLKIFDDFLINILDSIFDKIIIKEIDKNRAIFESLKIRIFSIACTVGLQKCIENAKAQFKNSQMNIKNLSENMQYPVYCQAIKYGNEEDFQNVYYRLITSEDEAERISLLEILPCSENVDLIKLLIENILNEQSEESFSDNEKLTLFISLTMPNSVGLNILQEVLETGNLKYFEGLDNNTHRIFSSESNEYFNNNENEMKFNDGILLEVLADWKLNDINRKNENEI